MGAAEVGPHQIGVDELGSAKLCAAQISKIEMGAAQVSFTEIDLIERCTHQVDLNVGIIFAPLIPRLDTPPQHRHMLLICHRLTSLLTYFRASCAFFSFKSY